MEQWANEFLFSILEQDFGKFASGQTQKKKKNVDDSMYVPLLLTQRWYELCDSAQPDEGSRNAMKHIRFISNVLFSPINLIVYFCTASAKHSICQLRSRWPQTYISTFIFFFFSFVQSINNWIECRLIRQQIVIRGYGLCQLKDIFIDEEMCVEKFV